MCHQCFVNKGTRHGTGRSRFSSVFCLLSNFNVPTLETRREATLIDDFRFFLFSFFSNFNVPTLEARLEATLIRAVHVFSVQVLHWIGFLWTIWDMTGLVQAIVRKVGTRL